MVQLDQGLSRRLDAASVPANEYLQQFPMPVLVMLAKLVAYVAGSFAAVLLVVAFIDESLLEAQVLSFLLIPQLWLLCPCCGFCRCAPEHLSSAILNSLRSFGPCTCKPLTAKEFKP